MNAASLVESSAMAPRPRPDDTDVLGERIAALAARLHAATYELLLLLRQFDAASGWNNGFLSCAHWLHWRTGIDLGAAREKVRVARALPTLPRLSARMRRGELSYAKVRALTRVATPENERALVNFALAGTAAQVERFVRAWRRADDAAAAQLEVSRHLQRSLSTWVDADGMVVIRGRLTPELGAVVQRALEAAADRLCQDTQGVSPGPSVVDEVTPAQRRADALGRLAEVALSADLDAGTAGERYQVVVHVDAVAQTAAKARGGDGRRVVNAGESAAACVDISGTAGGTVELNQGPVHVSAETSRRVACDASVVVMGQAADGPMPDGGRRTRTIPPSIRRALVARDATCQFPGCTSRRCDAHHVEHWADGGATRLDNLVRLCRRHHRAVHEGGFEVRGTAETGWRFHAPDGRVVPRAPSSCVDAALDAQLADVDAASIPVWDGTRFDLVWAMDVLYRPPSNHASAAS